MNCPNCNQELIKIKVGYKNLVSNPISYLVCSNLNCRLWGIKRVPINDILESKNKEANKKKDE
jgi:hypothetical protein